MVDKVSDEGAGQEDLPRTAGMQSEEPTITELCISHGRDALVHDLAVVELDPLKMASQTRFKEVICSVRLQANKLREKRT